MQKFHRGDTLHGPQNGLAIYTNRRGRPLVARGPLHKKYRNRARMQCVPWDGYKGSGLL